MELTSDTSSGVSEKTEYATLTVSGHDYCIDIGKIRETRRWSDITKLPHSPSFVLGVMNLRGVVIPIIDLSERLGFCSSDLSERHVIIIIENDGQTTGLVVDSVQEIISVSEDKLHVPPAGSQLGDECIISGLISHGDRMIRVIDVGLIMSSVRAA